MSSIKVNSGKPSLRCCYNSSFLCRFIQSFKQKCARFKEQQVDCAFFFFSRVLLTYPRLNVLSHTLTEYHHAFCFCKRYRISKSTHIYFIQIYIEFKYYISIWSFDTNQENPTIFNGKDVCVYTLMGILLPV